MRKFFLFCLSATLMLTACNDYGKKVDVSKDSEVYFKGEGVNEADAKKLGDFFVEQGYFDSSKKATAQLIKENDTYVVKLVVDEKEINSKKDYYKRNFWHLQNTIASKVFNGQKTKIVMADDNLKDIEVVGEIAKFQPNPANTILYNPKEVKEENVKQLGEFLTGFGYFNGSKELEVLLNKEKDTYDVRFIVDANALEQNKAQVMPFFLVSKYAMEKTIFNNQKSNVHLTGTNLVDIEEVKELTPEEKAAVDEQLSAGM